MRRFTFCAVTVLVFLAWCQLSLAGNNNNNNPSWAVKRPAGLYARNLNDRSGPAVPNTCTNAAWIADFVVIGSGAGGSAVTRKLIDAGYSVILLENGGYYNDRAEILDPLQMGNVLGPRGVFYGWQMKSDVEDVSRAQYSVNLASAFGGSTTHFGMQYVRGSRAFYDRWALHGGSIWNADNVYAAFERMESYLDEEPSLPTPPARGTNGFVKVRRPAFGPATGVGSLANKLADWSVQASGLPKTSDYNGAENPYGILTRYDLFQSPNRTRTSASLAYLNSTVVNPDGTAAARCGKKIRVFFDAYVVKVLFDRTKRAVAVDVDRNGYTERVWANKEVILSANIRSAQILENSGVGDAAYLATLGIDSVFNNPNVGKHLNNHPAAIMTFNANIAADGGIAGPQDPQSLYAGGGFFPSVQEDGTFAPIDITKPRSFQTLWLASAVPGTINYYTMLVHSNASGTQHTQSTNPFQIPLLKEAAFSDPNDLENYARFLFHFVQNRLGAIMHAADPAYSQTWATWNTVADAKAWLLKNQGKASHYVGLNAMSQDASSGVVDYAGRVFGVSGLRVVDTSIIPEVSDGNTGAVGMMIGERIGDMIVASYSH